MAGWGPIFHMKCTGSMDLDMTEVWRLVPHVADEHIQSLLPFRNTNGKGCTMNCKLPEPGATLRLRNVNRDASFVVMRYICLGDIKLGQMRSSRESGLGWCFLDLKEKRWYFYKDKDQKPRLNFGGVGVGIDGYQACQYFSNATVVNNEKTCFVFNPIAKTLTSLPAPPVYRSQCRELLLVVDSIDLQSFKLIYVHPSLHQKISETGDPSMYLEERFMHVFDSIFNVWFCVNNPRQTYLDNIDAFHMSKSVIFQSQMYILLSFPDRREHMLWRFNLSENVWETRWENVKVHIPGEMFMPKLIVSANRLFLGGWWEDLLSESKFQLTEIKIHSLTLQTVLEWSKSDVELLFEINTVGETMTENYFNVTGEVSKRIVCPSISAFGFGDSVMLMSVSSGSSMVYDVETGLVHQLDQKPWRHTPHDISSRVAAKKWINLLQPNTIWWHGQLLWTWQGA